MAIKMPDNPNEEKSNHIAIHFPESEMLSDARLLKLSSANRDLQLERSATGDLIVMLPAGGTSGRKNIRLAGQLYVWWQREKRGDIFDSSTGFTLPNGAMRAPDAAWVSDEQLATLSKEELESFPPICPDFVIELRSNTDSLNKLKEKMQEYLDNGAKLGWLIDPKSKTVFAYTPQGVQEFDGPEKLSAEPVLGFELDLLELW